MISVIVPVYNAAPFLTKCLDSILQQTYKELEILLIDDGSTDGSAEICDEYCACDDRCKVIHKQNEGVASARNRGLQEATGEYIGFIDNDDCIHPRYFEYLVRAINEGDFQLSMVLYKKTHVQKIERVEAGYATETVSHKSLRTVLYSIEKSDIPFGYMWAKLYRRELLDGLFVKEIAGEDIEFSFQVSNRLPSAIVVKEYMYYYLLHPESQSLNRSAEKLCTSVDCYSSILNEIPETDKYIRAHCLRRLYLIILNVRYSASHYKHFSEVREKVLRNIKSVIDSTVREFTGNIHIPLIYKIGLLTFYYIPPLYDLFRLGMERYHMFKTTKHRRK